MFNTDYKIEAIDELLNEDRILARYVPLVPYKSALIRCCRASGCLTKSDCLKLPDEAFTDAGFQDYEIVNLFRRFLTQYDVKPQKLKEIDAICETPEEASAFLELYQLPGVKRIRASLYYRSGYRSLAAIASASPEEIISKTKETIRQQELDCSVPLMKEVKTHIAVARAFTYG